MILFTNRTGSNQNRKLEANGHRPAINMYQKLKIFVSSTVYDLLDVRAEVEELLREMGADPILSDSATSDFRVFPDKNSIETCLINVRESDYVLVILSKRYGPSLEKAGFDNCSATHLEYRAAVEARRPILFYVRDRLESDLVIWEKNKDNVELSWVAPKDYPLFELIREHRPLSAKKKRSNWCQTFRNSIDLKNLIARDLRFPASKTAIARAIRDNHIPIFEFDMKSMDIKPKKKTLLLPFSFINIGTVPAYNVNMRWRGKKSDVHDEFPIIAPNGKLSQLLELHYPKDMISINKEGIIESHPPERINKQLIIEYQTPEGHRVIDEFVCVIEKVNIGYGENKPFVKLQKKTYKVGDEMPYVITE